MRITKTIATQVANEMLKQKQESIIQLQNKMKDVFTDAHLNTIPKDVLAVFKKYPSWVETSKSCRIKNEGFGWDYYSFSKAVPCVENWTLIDDESAKSISKISNKINDLKKEY